MPCLMRQVYIRRITTPWGSRSALLVLESVIRSRSHDVKLRPIRVAVLKLMLRGTYDIQGPHKSLAISGSSRSVYNINAFSGTAGAR